jgi:pantoate kinase
LPVSEAFCPAGISSFFQICDTETSGNQILDPARIGARGGGFVINRGITARVSLKKSPKTRVNIRINSKPAPHAQATRWAVEEFMKTKGLTLTVNIDLRVTVPVAAGFGSSAAGTLAACRALADAADLPTTLNELGRITHVAEVVNHTGLGTASALLSGGFNLVAEPGAPGFGLVDKLFFPKDHYIICAYLGPTPTREALAKLGTATQLNEAARQAMEAIRRSPDLATFLREARTFGAKSGFESANVSRIISLMMSAGAIGAAQNMIGEAVHGVAADPKVTRVVDAVRREFPAAKVFAARLDDRGVRLVKKNPKH